MSQFFNIIVEKIYCISLRERQDRRDLCKLEFNKLGITNVYYHIVDRHLLGGAHGCTQSHIECVMDAKNNDYENILIFEDDVFFTDNAVNIINNDKIKIPDDYWFFYLGGSLRLADFYGENVIHSLLIQTTHAYILNKRAFDLILKYGPMNVSIDNYLINRIDYINLPIKEKYLVQNTINKDKIIDCFYARIAFNEKKSYMVYPMICYQKDDYSNILNKNISYYEYMNESLNNSIIKFKNKLNNLS